MASSCSLGIRVEKSSTKDWPILHWAAFEPVDRKVIGHASVRPPRTYDEATALRHVHEKVQAAVREHKVIHTLVWTIETVARVNNTMRPRLRMEGVVCAAASLAGATAELATWAEVSARSAATATKADYEKATEIEGVAVGGAHPFAVLAAIAASGAS
ncbi:MAG TPA: hypothetical protein VF407_23535 [Polyangiaceae bacterium]